MADILDEIKDDIKQERYERLITVHGSKLLGLAALVVIIAAAYKIYKSSKYDDSVAQGRVFYEAFEGNKSDLYDQIIASDHEGYKILSSFSKAGISKSKGDIETAIKTLDNLKGLSNSNKALEEYARLTSLFLVATSEDKWKGKEADIGAALEALYTSNSPFALTAKQTHAIFLYKIGNNEKARTLFSDLASQRDIPPSIIERAKNFIKIIDGQ